MENFCGTLESVNVYPVDLSTFADIATVGRKLEVFIQVVASHPAHKVTKNAINKESKQSQQSF